jgi:hypothetical protein
MQKIVLIAALTIGLLAIPFSAHAEVYKWVDDKGDVHFTDDYSKIPEKYRPVAETRRFPQDPKDTSPANVEKKPTPALAPKVSEPPVQKKVSESAVQKAASVLPEVFVGVISKLDDFGRSFVVTDEAEKTKTMSLPISEDTKIIDEFGREVPFEDLTRRISVTASGVPVSVKYIRDGDDVHTSTITIRAQKEFNGREHRRPRPPRPPKPPK